MTQNCVKAHLHYFNMWQNNCCISYKNLTCTHILTYQVVVELLWACCTTCFAFAVHVDLSIVVDLLCCIITFISYFISRQLDTIVCGSLHTNCDSDCTVFCSAAGRLLKLGFIQRNARNGRHSGIYTALRPLRRLRRARPLRFLRTFLRSLRALR